MTERSQLDVLTTMAARVRNYIRKNKKNWEFCWQMHDASTFRIDEADKEEFEKIMNTLAEDPAAYCNHEADLATLSLPQDIHPMTGDDDTIEFIIDVVCSKCGLSGSFAVTVKPDDINWE